MAPGNENHHSLSQKSIQPKRYFSQRTILSNKSVKMERELSKGCPHEGSNNKGFPKHENRLLVQRFFYHSVFYLFIRELHSYSDCLIPYLIYHAFWHRWINRATHVKFRCNSCCKHCCTGSKAQIWSGHFCVRSRTGNKNLKGNGKMPCYHAGPCCSFCR